MDDHSVRRVSPCSKCSTAVDDHSSSIGGLMTSLPVDFLPGGRKSPGNDVINTRALRQSTRLDAVSSDLVSRSLIG